MIQYAKFQVLSLYAICKAQKMYNFRAFIVLNFQYLSSQRIKIQQMNEQKTTDFLNKSLNFYSDPPNDFLIERQLQNVSQDQYLWPLHSYKNQMLNVEFPHSAGQGLTFNLGFQLLDNRFLNFDGSKNKEVDHSLIQKQVNSFDSQFSSQKSFRVLRNGKKQSPKPLCVNNKFLQRSACKNALQFFSWAIDQYFKQQNFLLTSQQQRLIYKLKNAPSIRGFDQLFNVGGNIKVGLCQLFLSDNLWELILRSRVRHHRYKLIMKKISNMIRKAFICQRFQGLSSLKPQNQMNKSKITN